MIYKIIYDITQDQNSSGIWPSIILFPFLIIITFLLSLAFMKNVPVRKVIIVFVLGCFLSAACSCGVILSGFTQNNAARTILANGNALIIDDTVANFEPATPGGRKVESFTVKNVVFQYNSADLSNPGYKHESGLDGPIKNGIAVRIHYYYDSSRKQNIILKLEIGGQLK